MRNFPVLPNHGNHFFSEEDRGIASLSNGMVDSSGTCQSTLSNVTYPEFIEIAPYLPVVLGLDFGLNSGDQTTHRCGTQTAPA
jgi:hypothetical protein